MVKFEHIKKTLCAPRGNQTCLAGKSLTLSGGLWRFTAGKTVETNLSMGEFPATHGADYQRVHEKIPEFSDQLINHYFPVSTNIETQICSFF